MQGISGNSTGEQTGRTNQSENIDPTERHQGSRRIRIRPPEVSDEILPATPTVNSRNSTNAGTNYAEVLTVSLRDLRFGNETDISLVTIPTLRRSVRLPNLTPPHDEPTANLHGIDYFTALENDSRLPGALSVLCGGTKLARNSQLSTSQLDEYTKKIRFIASRVHNGSDEFKDQINALAMEAQIFCGDRTSYFLEQMHGLALLDLLSGPGHTSKRRLYNLGVAFYKLDLVKNETCRRMASASNQFETVQDVLIAEYLLQDELGLPTSHSRPIHLGTGNMTPEIANEIKEAVISRLLSKDGVYVIDFLSGWQPWAKYIEQLEENQDDFNTLQGIYADNLQMHLEHPDLPEVTKIERSEDCMDRHRCWKEELVGQKTREYLINYRADLLIQCGVMPRPLASGARP